MDRVKSFLHHLNRRDTQLLPTISLDSRFFFFCFFILMTFVVIKKIHAQGFADEYIKRQAATEQASQEGWIDNSILAYTLSFNKTLFGKFDQKALNGEVTYFVPSGFVGVLNSYIAQLYSPPASGVEYIAQIKDTFLGKPVYAQGVGFKGLQPILKIWKSLRNLIYILSSIFFIFLGLLIMLRIKISNQAVVTIQYAIPQIITTLILVTFSYAISGLLIDICNFIQAFALSTLFSVNPTPLNSNLLTNLKDIDTTFLGLSNMEFSKYFGLVVSAIPLGATIVIAGTIGAIVGGLMGSLAGGVPVPLIGNVVGGGAGAFAGAALLILVVGLIICILLFRFFVGLIKAYFSVILKIILSPLEIGLGAFPNSKVNFSTWVTDIVANLSIFPISLIFLVIVNLILQSISSSNDPFWTPSMLTGIPSLIPAIIGFSSLMLLSSLPSLIPEFLFNIKPSPLAKTAGQNFANLPIAAFMYGAIQKSYGEKIGGQYVNAIQRTVGRTKEQVQPKKPTADAHGEGNDDSTPRRLRKFVFKEVRDTTNQTTNNENKINNNDSSSGPHG